MSLLLLSVVLYGDETWSVTLREEKRMKSEISGSHGGEYED
jgi:hypothetical protein